MLAGLSKSATMTIPMAKAGALHQLNIGMMDRSFIRSAVLRVKFYSRSPAMTEFLFPVAVYSVQELTASLTAQGFKWETE
ncbi:hypothetical protein APU22_08590 [Klebsiella pneumoniae]|nr:hypothetical protein APU22_08590 [Klebsiella pneumoniae]